MMINNLLKIKPEFLRNSIKNGKQQILNNLVDLTTSSTSPTSLPSSYISSIKSKRYFSSDSDSFEKPQQQTQQQQLQPQQQQQKSYSKYPTAELFKSFSKSFIDPFTGEIDFLKIKERVDYFSNDNKRDKLEFLFTWATKVMKTKNILIMEIFLYQFRKLRMKTFLQVLEYINQNDIPQNIFIFNISLYYYSENGMIDEARKLTELLLSMGSQLPEKAYIAIINTFKEDYQLLKRIDDLARNGGVTDDKTRLLNELFIFFIENHRDLESALKILDVLEGEQLQVYFNSMVSLLQFFANNNMQDHAISLLKNLGLKYPTWFSSKKFCERMAPIILSLHQYLTEIIDHADENGYTSVNLYNTLIQTFSTNKNTKAVVELYNKMIKKFAPNPVTIRSLILFSIKEENVDQCLYWFGVLKGLGFYLNSKMFIYFIRFFISKKQYNTVEELIEDYKVQKQLWTPISTAYVIYYFSYIKENPELRKKIDPVFMSLFEESIEFREDATDHLIQLCLMDDRYKDAELWFNNKSIKYGIQPKVNSYLNFISYHRIRNEYQQANYWIKKMNKEINLDIQDTTDEIFDYYHKYYQPKDTTTSKLNYKEKSIKRLEILDKLQQDPVAACEMVFALMEKRDSTITEEFFINIIRKLSNMNRIEEIKKIYESSLIFGYIPTFKCTYAFLNNFYKKSGYKNYIDYINNPPLGAFKKDFEKSHLCNLAQFSLRKCLKLLETEPKYNQYIDSREFLNGLLFNLINMQQFQRVGQLIQTMFDRDDIKASSYHNLKFDESVLELYFLKFIENQIHIQFINKILNYFQVNSIQFNIPLIKAAMASNLLIEGKIEDSYKLYKQVLQSGYGNITVYDLGIRIYSKVYPIPPLQNETKWKQLMSQFNQEFGVNIKSMYTQYFKSLIQLGRSDLVRKEIGSNTFDFNNLSFETISLMFQVYKDKPEKILGLATLLHNKKYILKDKQIIKLIEDAHSQFPKTNPKEIGEILKKVKTLNYIEDFKFTNEESLILDRIIDFKQNHLIYNEKEDNNNNNSDSNNNNNNNNNNINNINNNNNNNKNKLNDFGDINRNINRDDILLV